MSIEPLFLTVLSSDPRSWNPFDSRLGLHFVLEIIQSYCFNPSSHLGGHKSFLHRLRPHFPEHPRKGQEDVLHLY